MPKSFLNKPGYPIGLRNNNPGNLRPGDSWKGMLGTNGGFIVFENIGYGIRAMTIDLTSKIRNGYNTIGYISTPDIMGRIINRWAPESENDTSAYIDAVVRSTGMSEGKLLTADGPTLRKLIRAIIKVENGSFAELISDADINEGMAMADSNLINVGNVGFGVASALFLLSLYLLATMEKMPKRG